MDIETGMDVSQNDLGLQSKKPESQTPMYIYDKLHKPHSGRLKRKRLDGLNGEITLTHRKKKRVHLYNDEESSCDEDEEDLDPDKLKEMITSKLGDLFGNKDDDRKGKSN